LGRRRLTNGFFKASPETLTCTRSVGNVKYTGRHCTLNHQSGQPNERRSETSRLTLTHLCQRNAEDSIDLVCQSPARLQQAERGDNVR
jgi:hypothetical protein